RADVTGRAGHMPADVVMSLPAACATRVSTSNPTAKLASASRPVTVLVSATARIAGHTEQLPCTVVPGGLYTSSRSRTCEENALRKAANGGDTRMVAPTTVAAPSLSPEAIASR